MKRRVQQEEKGPTGREDENGVMSVVRRLWQLLVLLHSLCSRRQTGLPGYHTCVPPGHIHVLPLNPANEVMCLCGGGVDECGESLAKYAVNRM